MFLTFAIQNQKQKEFEVAFRIAAQYLCFLVFGNYFVNVPKPFRDIQNLFVYMFLLFLHVESQGNMAVVHECQSIWVGAADPIGPFASTKLEENNQVMPKVSGCSGPEKVIVSDKTNLSSCQSGFLPGSGWRPSSISFCGSSGSSIRIVKSTPFAMDNPSAPSCEEVPFCMMIHRTLHEAGTCIPCLYHRKKEDGCRKGDAAWQDVFCVYFCLLVFNIALCDLVSYMFFVCLLVVWLLWSKTGWYCLTAFVGLGLLAEADSWNDQIRPSNYAFPNSQLYDNWLLLVCRLLGSANTSVLKDVPSSNTMHWLGLKSGGRFSVWAKDTWRP